MASMGTRDGKPFFGLLSCYTKMSVTSPVLAYSALRLDALTLRQRLKPLDDLKHLKTDLRRSPLWLE